MATTNPRDAAQPAPRRARHLKRTLRKQEEKEEQSQKELAGGVFTLRPRSRTKEQEVVRRWKDQVLLPEGTPVNHRGKLLEHKVWKVVSEALPSPGISLGERDGTTGGLPGVPANSLPAHGAIAERIWSHTAWVILTKPEWVREGFHQTLRCLVDTLMSALCPRDLKTSRTLPSLETAVVAAAGMNELMYALRRPKSDRAQVVRFLVPPKEKRGLEQGHGALWRGAVRSLIRRQRNAALGGAGRSQQEDLGEVYTLTGEYLGYTSEWRGDARPTSGYTTRGVEHLVRVARPEVAGGKKRRYHLLRRRGRGSLGFLALRRARAKTALAMEGQAINGVRTKGNEKMKKRPRMRGGRQVRLPPWVRTSREKKRSRTAKVEEPQRKEGKGAKERRNEFRLGPLDSKEARKACRAKVRFYEEEEEKRKEEKKKEQNETTKRKKNPRSRGARDPGMRGHVTRGGVAKGWEKPYAQAYQEMQERRKAWNGSVGPIDILSPKHRRLFLLWMVKAEAKAKVDWKEVGRRWGVEYPELEVARASRRLGRQGRSRRVWSTAIARIKERNLPTPATLRFKVEAGVPKSTARKELRRVIETKADIHPEVRVWVKEELKIQTVTAQTFTKKRNPGAVVKKATLSEVREFMSERENDVMAGRGLKRLPGSSKVPTPQRMADLVRHLQEHKQNLSRILNPLPCSPPTGSGRPKHTRKAIAPISEEAYEEIFQNLPKRSRSAQTHLEEYASHYEGVAAKTHTCCAEDKSMNETWLIAVDVYLGLVFMSLLVAKWVLLGNLTVKVAEYAVRQHYIDELPPRMARFLPKILSWKGSLLPYIYNTIKWKCFKGEASHPKSCTKEGHSCTRKIVSYFNTWGRDINRIYHRGAQRILEELPTHELWALKDGPRTLRRKFDRLVYLPAFENTCIFCGCKKQKATGVVQDAGQAYEQTLIGEATADLIWACAYVLVATRKNSVTVNRNCPGLSFLGGTVASFLDFRLTFVVLTFGEVCHWVWVVLAVNLIVAGDTVWLSRGITIGNPFGRIGLGATTGRDEVERSKAWKTLTLPDPAWNRVAALYTEEQIFASTKYVDDRNTDSLTACRRCIEKYSATTYRAEFEVTPGRKFLDCRKHFHGKKPGVRPTLSLTPVHKNEGPLMGPAVSRKEKDKEGKPKLQEGWTLTSCAPWWAPFSTSILAGIFWGAVLRYRDIVLEERRRVYYLGLLTLEYVLRGYKIKSIRDAWGKTPWSTERYRILQRLGVLRRPKYRTITEDRDLLALIQETREQLAAECRSSCLGQDLSSSSVGTSCNQAAPLLSSEQNSSSSVSSTMTDLGTGGAAGFVPGGRGDLSVGYWDQNDQYYNKQTGTWIAKWKWHQSGGGQQQKGGGKGRKRSVGGQPHYQPYQGGGGAFQPPPPQQQPIIINQPPAPLPPAPPAYPYPPPQPPPQQMMYPQQVPPHMMMGQPPASSGGVAADAEKKEKKKKTKNKRGKKESQEERRKRKKDKRKKGASDSSSISDSSESAASSESDSSSDSSPDVKKKKKREIKKKKKEEAKKKAEEEARRREHQEERTRNQDYFERTIQSMTAAVSEVRAVMANNRPPATPIVAAPPTSMPQTQPLPPPADPAAAGSAAAAAPATAVPGPQPPPPPAPTPLEQAKNDVNTHMPATQERIRNEVANATDMDTVNTALGSMRKEELLKFAEKIGLQIGPTDQARLGRVKIVERINQEAWKIPAGSP